MRLDVLQRGDDASGLAGHDPGEDHEPQDDADRLHEIGDRIGHQPAQHRVGDDDCRRDGDAGDQRQIRNGAHDLPEGADLGRAPDDGPGQDQQDRQALNRLGIALAEEVGERDVAAAPEGDGDRHADDQEGRGISERVDRRADKTLAVDRAGGADDRFGAEPGGKHREGGDAEPELAAGVDVVALGEDAPRHPRPDCELQQHVAEHAQQHRIHLPPTLSSAPRHPSKATRPQASGPGQRGAHVHRSGLWPL